MPEVTKTGSAALLQVHDLGVEFTGRGLLSRSKNRVRAVNGVSFNLAAGRTLGLVGESGCGKTTLGRAVVGLERNATGSARFDGRELTTLSAADWRPLRRELQIVMQDPYTALNPRRTVLQSIVEAWETHPGIVPRERWTAEAKALLDRVGVNPDHAGRRPHQFSGGQRQRVSIARALAVRPRVLVCDEPTSALDVSIQAQILNLIADLQTEYGLAILFISHDLGVVRQIADEVAVMYLGKIMEHGPTEAVYADPVHPYTQALLSAVPSMDGELRRIPLVGPIPSPTDPPSGCPLRTRCWKAVQRCADEVPALRRRIGTTEAACHFPEPLDTVRRHLGVDDSAVLQ